MKHTHVCNFAWLTAALGAPLFSGCAQTATVQPELTRPLAGSRGPLVGVELVTWIVGDPPTAPGVTPSKQASTPAGIPEAVFAEYADRPLPFAPDVIAAWRSCGMGIVSMPATEVLHVRERLAMAGPVQSLQVPLSPRWMTGASGTRVENPQLVKLDSGLVRFDRAQPRLLVRAWAVPREKGSSKPQSIGALAQLQVVPQIAALSAGPVRRTPGELLSGSPAVASDEDAGQLLSRLTLEAACSAGDAFIIYPLLAEVEPDAATTTDAPRGLGPDAPEPPTLGEVLLSDALALKPRRDRTVLVILPHPPKEFRLIE